MSKSQSKRKKKLQQQRLARQEQIANREDQRLRGPRKLFMATAFLTTILSFGVGLMAIVTSRDKLLTIISFSAGGATFLLTVVQAFPRVISHMRDSLRALLYVVVVLVALGMGPLSWVVFQQPVIKIGVSLPFSGGDQQDAMPIYNAIKQAIEDQKLVNNKLESYHIELVPFDDSKVADSISLRSPDNPSSIIKSTTFVKLVQDEQLAAIIGPFNSGAAIHEIPIAKRSSLPLISPANTSDCLTQKEFSCAGFDLDQSGFQTYFRTASVDFIRETAFADFFARKYPGDSRVVIYRDGTPFGDSFAERFAERWQQLSPSHQKPKSFLAGSDPAESLRKLGPVPDAILFAGTGADGIDLHKAMQRNPAFSNTAFGAAATIMNGGFNEHLKVDPNGVIYAIAPMPYDEQKPETSQFISNYENHNGYGTPTPYSASAYDATGIAFAAIRATIPYNRPPIALLGNPKPFRKKVIEKITNTDEYKGVTGTIRFDKNGDVEFAGQDDNQGVSIHIFMAQTQKWKNVPF